MTYETQHYLSVGVLSGNKIKNEKQIGNGYYVAHAEKPYFTLQLWQQPHQAFYVVKNKGNGKYTIFSRIVESDDIPIFQRPVGYGHIHTDMKETLILQFNFPWQRCFLSLYPENKGESLNEQST